MDVLQSSAWNQFAWRGDIFFIEFSLSDVIFAHVQIGAKKSRKLIKSGETES